MRRAWLVLLALWAVEAQLPTLLLLKVARGSYWSYREEELVPSSGNMYLRVLKTPTGGTATYAYAITIMASIQPEWLSQAYFQNMPDNQKLFPSPPQHCEDLWGRHQVSMGSNTYGLVNEPTQSRNPSFPLLDMDKVRKCEPRSACRGCYAPNQDNFLFFITLDDDARTLLALGTCQGWMQLGCPDQCLSGQYATARLEKDPLNGLNLVSADCRPCSPGTWNTCYTPKTECSW